MTQPTENETIATPNSNAPASSGLDFSNISNLKLNDLEATVPAQSLISQANVLDDARPVVEDVKIENL